jgi:EAL domain-containing protein (putative c-di-GMP-specific phosphodiesterase class I)/DNA-binding NarL/FixJ family response regulator
VVDLHVLVVEGDVAHCAGVTAALRQLNIANVQTAKDGMGGLKAIAASSRPFDIVISDLDMEGMDGLEFIRHVVASGAFGLILCSAQDDAVLSSADWMARAYKAPLLGVLRKPLDVLILANLIARIDGNCTVFSDILPDRGSDERPNQRALDDINDALDTHQFVPFYQPKVSLTTGELVGAEILARWDHPELGIRSPVQFVDLMERGGMIERLTFTILEQACRHVTAWTASGLDVPLAINVSPMTLGHPYAASRLLERIMAANIPRSMFTIEITEKAFTNDTASLLENVLRMRMQGCGISVDDFGTGYSSLQQLNRIPVTELKLDRSFVRRMAKNSKALSIVTSMIDLAQRLKLKTVAEGIDNEEQRRMLAQLGCDVGQGYLFARPMSANQLTSWMKRRRRAAA